MKVIQVLNHFLPQQTAGTEVYTWALSKQLQQKNIEVKVVIPHYGKKESVAYVYDGLTVCQYAEPSVVDRSLIIGLRNPDGLKDFIAHIVKEQPDIVHFHELAGSNGITLQHVIAAKNTGAKVIMTFHLAGNTCKTGNLLYKDQELCDGIIRLQKCSRCYLHKKGNVAMNALLLPVSFGLNQLGIDTTKWNSKWGTALGTVHLIEQLKEKFEILVAHCDRLVAITKWYEEILLLNAVQEHQISYIPQGLPVEPSVKIPDRVEKTSTAIRLIFLGRINPFKGLHLLLEAILDMPAHLIILDIYGQTGDDAYEHEWRTKTAGRANIFWKGKLRQEEVVHTMQQYDALCLCSTFSEMSPLVIQEAFAAGIPVIASNVYGNAEQIKSNVNGLLFRFKDVASLKEQLQRCINEPALLKQLKTNLTVPRSFKEVADAYIELYKEVVG
jgi:glycosyltransferase involved in cell wall biosynthesis